MKFLPLTLCLAGIMTLASCDHPDRASQPPAEQDSVQLVTLLHDVYQWHEKRQDSLTDFPLIVKDSFQTGLDRKQFDRNLAVLRQTDYFTSAFLKNYEQIGEFIDHKLTTAQPKLLNEINFSFQDSDPWTGFQEEFPAWQNFRFSSYRQTVDTASFQWRVADSNSTSEPYKVGFAKEAGKWKISYLQGFDRKDYSQ